MHIDLGTRLGVYEVIAPLGAGGMGEVYRARDTRLNRVVAIKVLAAEALDRADARARFQREALATAALNHPHICTLYDVGHQNGLDFIVMEYVQGETLAARLSRGPLPVPQAVAYACEIARAIHAAHDCGIVHRDLKPSNIMLTASGAKLLDFGLAKLHQARQADLWDEVPTRADDISRDGGLVGTLRYLAPEVLKGGEADARSDLFSFGAVLYEMTTGEPPFNGLNDARLIAAILSEEPRPLLELQPEAPPALAWIVRTCLAKNPTERWQDAREIVHQLNLLAREHAIVLADSHTPAPRVQGSRTLPLRGRVAFAAAALLASSIASIYFAVPVLWPAASGGADADSPPHVVVVPCRPLGHVAAADVALCDGLAAILTAKLAQLTVRHTLQVTPASEVYARGITTADEARRGVGATLALEGHLFRTGEDVRITYALVDTSRRRQVDGITVTARAADPFAAEDRLFSWAIEALRLSVARDERVALRSSRTQSSEAYAFTTQGHGYLLDYQRSGAIDAAIGLFSRALEHDARYALAHAGSGQGFWLKYQATKAVALIGRARAACRQALNLDPQLAAAYLCAGTIESGTGEYEQAIALFERALQIDASNDEAYRRLANAYEALGRFDQALATYARAVDIRPQYWATHVWLANLHRTRGHYDDAVRLYEHAVTLTPDNAPLRGILAGMYMFLGRYDDALREAQASLALDPSYITHVAIGMTYYRMRRFDTAVAALEKAHALLEDFRTTGNLARACYWAGQRERALVLFERAAVLGEQELAINPRNDEVHVAVADYYARLGRRADALRHLDAATLDVNPHFMFFAAIVHAQLGDHARARSWLDRSLAAGLPSAEATAWIDITDVLK